MMNPFAWARTRLQNETVDPPIALSQHDVAKDLGLTQQFVQKVEEGLMSTAPDSISYYFDTLLSAEQKMDYLKQILDKIRELNEGSHNPIKIPRRFVYGTPQFAVPTLGGLYTLWVIYERATLTDLSGFVTQYEAGQIIPYKSMNEAQTAVGLMLSAADYPEENSQWAYQLARLLKMNPYIIQRWEKLNKAVPPTLRIAIAQTGRSSNG